MKCHVTGLIFGLVNIYEPQATEKKQECWTQVSSWLAAHSDIHCLVVEDFNVIRNLDEKQGGKRKLEADSDQSNEFIDHQ